MTSIKSACAVTTMLLASTIALVRPARAAPVPDGYGEMIVVQTISDKSNPNWSAVQPIPDTAYDDLFAILFANSPIGYLTSDPDVAAARDQAAKVIPDRDVIAIGANKLRSLLGARVATLQQQLTDKAKAASQPSSGPASKYDFDYQACFVPRSLYELFFVNAILDEEQRLPYSDWRIVPPPATEDFAQTAAANKSRALVELSREMNNYIVGQLTTTYAAQFPKGKLTCPLTDTQLRAVLDGELTKFSTTLNKWSGNNDDTHKFAPVRGSVKVSLGNNLAAAFSDDGAVQGMADIIRRAMDVEMVSAGRFILYRGTEYAEQLWFPVSSQYGRGPQQPVSYATGLFPGALYDVSIFTGAFMYQTAMKSLLEQSVFKGGGYALPLDWGALLDPGFPFAVPMGTTAQQLGIAGHAHAWSKMVYEVWRRAYASSPFWKPMVSGESDGQRLHGTFVRYNAATALVVWLIGR